MAKIKKGTPLPVQALNAIILIDEQASVIMYTSIEGAG